MKTKKQINKLKISDLEEEVRYAYAYLRFVRARRDQKQLSKLIK